jgi:hypothetical protein
MKWKEFGVLLLIVAVIMVGAKLTFGHPDLIQYKDWYMSTSITEDHEVVYEIVTFDIEEKGGLMLRRYAKLNKVWLSFHSAYGVAEGTMQIIYIDGEPYGLKYYDNVVAAMKEGTTATVHYLDGNNKKRAMQFSLMGFTRTHLWLMK